MKFWVVLISLLAICSGRLDGDEPKLDVGVQSTIERYCYQCHSGDSREGNLSFDQLLRESDQEKRNRDWYRVFRQLRADLMPPKDESQPSDVEKERITNWIKSDAFEIEENNPRPGRVTVRRMNRSEYRNAIRDLFGIDFDTSVFFPADDTGHGFDNIGDVLSVSPLLLEKYVDAANEITRRAVPTSSRVIRTESYAGTSFHAPSESPTAITTAPQRSDRVESNSLELSYYESAEYEKKVTIGQDGKYIIELHLKANETYVDDQFDLNKCRFEFFLDDQKLMEQEFVRQGGKQYKFDFHRDMTVGEHQFRILVSPLTKERQIRKLRLSVETLALIGPSDVSKFVKPANYERFFPREVPLDELQADAYARDLLDAFATRAFRRPVDQETLSRLWKVSKQLRNAGKSFEVSIGTAMTAIIASPRFLFREETYLSEPGNKYPLMDEYSLASRLSFFLWSSIPDEELLQLAAQNKLRTNLNSQIDRMLKDPRAKALIENFVGQWLQVRSLESIQINSFAVLRRETRREDPEADAKRRRFFELFRKTDRTDEENKEFEVLQASQASRMRQRGPELNGQIRYLMTREAEMFFDDILSKDASLLDLINGRYTFLNETLADYYSIANVQGSEMRRVELPSDSVRGGILTSGAFLAVTSNPDRTSPVKRGLFVLENILGMPSGAPPPDVPALDEGTAGRPFAQPKRSLRETLAQHRENPLCSSCHNRMDPLGFAFENFNAMARYRTEEVGQPIDPSGTLVTGESFKDVVELKNILADSRRKDFYRCVAEKMLTYALGRSVEYYDSHTIDCIVEKLEANRGSAMTLVREIIASNSFQRTEILSGNNPKSSLLSSK